MNCVQRSGSFRRCFFEQKKRLLEEHSRTVAEKLKTGTMTHAHQESEAAWKICAAELMWLTELQNRKTEKGARSSSSTRVRLTRAGGLASSARADLDCLSRESGRLVKRARDGLDAIEALG